MRVNAAARAHPESREPASRFAPDAGSLLSPALLPAAERARQWAGDGLRALILSGSHATGEAVWAEADGHRVSLSDIDLYAIMRDEAACDAARARATADRLSAQRESLAWGLAAPLEVAFLTLEGLARQPARPGTVALARSGRVLMGDATVLSGLPPWLPQAVTAEERLLLLENRAFELLWAATAQGDSLVALRARHAVLKTALDLATVRTLRHGELPEGAQARVARASALGAPTDLPSWLARAWDGIEALWRDALVWRAGAVAALAPAEARAEWRAVARAWSTAWWAERDGVGVPRDPWERALAAAARAPLARRVRRGLGASTPDGVQGRLSASVLARVRHALAGTPQHRIHGSAVVLILAAAQSPQEPRLSGGALRALARLGVTRSTSFDAAALDTLRA